MNNKKKVKEKKETNKVNIRNRIQEIERKDGRYIVISRLDDAETYLYIGTLTNESNLDAIARLLFFLPTFSCSFKNNKLFCSIIEDLLYIKRSYKIIGKIKFFYSSDFEFSENIVFNHPVVFDTITNSVVEYKENNRISTMLYNRICIVYPYGDPLKREILLKNIFEMCPEIIVVTGNKYGNNTLTVASLYSSYIEKCECLSQLIVNEQDGVKSIIDSLDTLSEFYDLSFYEIFIGCLSEDINNIKKELKQWNRPKRINIRYYCPYS